MGYFEDYKDGYTESDEIERGRMEEAGFDPDCIEDKMEWRKKRAINGKRGDSK